MDRVEADYTGQEAQNLINILTTNHTYFMREPEHFEFFKNVILPELKNGKRLEWIYGYGLRRHRQDRNHIRLP